MDTTPMAAQGNATNTTPTYITDSKMPRLLTNFDKEELARYRAAVKQFASVETRVKLSIREEAFDRWGKPVERCHALWCSNPEGLDLTRFWDIFDGLFTTGWE